MKKISLLVMLFVLPLTACNPGDDEGGTLTAELSGGKEVCEQADRCGGTATGTADVEINSDQNELCYELELNGVQNVTVAHIHAGEEGEAGPVLINLNYEGNDSGTDNLVCLDGLKESDLEDISEEPGEYYVNVHSEQYPDGALRGQLEES